jgi:hypothetical protein
MAVKHTAGPAPVLSASSRPLERTSHRREYLSAEQLAERTPWSVAALQKMIHRGVLRRDVHYFQPFGRGTQLLFKWSAIVQLIEGPTGQEGDRDTQNMAGRGHLDLEKAKARLLGLLSRDTA